MKSFDYFCILWGHDSIPQLAKRQETLFYLADGRVLTMEEIKKEFYSCTRIVEAVDEIL